MGKPCNLELFFCDEEEEKMATFRLESFWEQDEKDEELWGVGERRWAGCRKHAHKRRKKPCKKRAKEEKKSFLSSSLGRGKVGLSERLGFGAGLFRKWRPRVS